MNAIEIKFKNLSCDDDHDDSPVHNGYFLIPPKSPQIEQSSAMEQTLSAINFKLSKLVRDVDQIQLQLHNIKLYLNNQNKANLM